MAARKRSRKTTTRRRRSQGVNLVNAAQSVIILNATTKALFGLDAVTFATAGWLRPSPGGGTLASPMPGNSWGITAKELVQGLTGTGKGFGQSGSGAWSNDMDGLVAAMKNNLSNHGAQAVATMVFIPAAFKVGKKLTSKPRADANRLLKMTGLNSVVKV